MASQLIKPRLSCSLFLAKVDNLVKNGRLSKLVGTVVGLLNIRMVGEASKTGTLELLQKARGREKAIKAAFDELLKAGYAGGHITIAHRNNRKIYRAILWNWFVKNCPSKHRSPSYFWTL